MTRSELDQAMKSLAPDKDDLRAECYQYPDDNKLVCPCCGGSGEHYAPLVTPYIQDVQRQCTLCDGWGYLILRRPAMDKLAYAYIHSAYWEPAPNKNKGRE